jgi:N-acetylneuraminic acid mutarotase
VLATANPGFTPRAGHQLVVHKDRLWMIGADAAGNTNGTEVWVSDDGIKWSPVPQQKPFTERNGFRAVSFKDRLWVVSGFRLGFEKLDIWSSPDGATWEWTHPEAFVGRESHQCVVFNNKLWMIGGLIAPGPLSKKPINDIVVTEDGKSLAPVVSPEGAAFPPRYSHAVAVLGDSIWMSGGRIASGQSVDVLTNEVWFSKDGIGWKPSPAPTQISPRAGHAMVSFKNRLWVIGGMANTSKVASNTGSMVGDVWVSDSIE